MNIFHLKVLIIIVNLINVEISEFIYFFLFD